MPKVEFRYEDSGAQGVKANLQTTEQVAHKLGQEIQQLNKKAQLAEARKGTKEYQAALERLAQAQGKVAQQTQGVQQKLEGMKKSLGIGALNAAREMTGAIVSMTRGLYNLGKAGAVTEEQKKQFAQMDSAIASVEKSVGKLVAVLITNTGWLKNTADGIRILSDAADVMSVKVGESGESVSLLSVAFSGALSNLSLLSKKAREWNGATIDVNDKLRIEYDRMKRVKDKADELAIAMGKLTLENRTYSGVTGVMTATHENNIHSFIKGGAHYGAAADLLADLTDTSDTLTKSIKEQAVAWDEIGGNVGFALDEISGMRAGLMALSEQPGLAGMGAGLQGFEALRGIGAGVGASIGDQPLMQGNLDETQALAKANEEAFIGLANSFDVFGEAAHLANSELGKTGKVLGGIGLIIPELSKAFSKSGTALDKWGAAIGGMKALTAAFTDDKGKQAALMGFWEQAEAVGALARGIGGDLSGYAEAAGHQAAAVAYWAVAAKGGHGGGGGAAAGSPAPTSGTMGPDPFRTQDASPRESTNIYIETIDPGKAGESVLDAVEQYGRRGGARKISTNLMGTNQGSQEF